MTDKQIIIHGVDVSGCEWYSSTYFKPCDGCKNTPNCCYKQLKRKEQECEEFRKANDEKNKLLAKLGYPTTATAKRKVFCLQEQLDQLKVENEEFKKLLKVRIEDLCDSCGASSMMPMPCKVYEKTLTEIKEIAEEQIPYLDIDKAKPMIVVEYDYVGKIYILEQRMNIILQKIKGVLK